MAIIHKFNGNQNSNIYQWAEVIPIPSSNPIEVQFIKHVLVGQNDGAKNFVIRYFELPVGACSPLHTHDHEHGVIILHGKAKLQVEDTFTDLFPMDAVYIPGGELHQFSNTGDGKLGFFCTIIRSAEF